MHDWRVLYGTTAAAAAAMFAHRGFVYSYAELSLVTEIWPALVNVGPLLRKPQQTEHSFGKYLYLHT